jgi:hypothetical protein
MFFRHREIVTTEAVAIGRVEVLRMHAAGIFVAPAIGEFFGCRCLRSRTQVLYLGQWEDVKRASSMLAMIRSAMDREFADFLSSMEACENPRMLAPSFAQGMGHRISKRLQRLKSGRTGRAADLFQGLLDGAKRRSTSSTTIAHRAGIAAGSRVSLQ